MKKHLRLFHYTITSTTVLEMCFHLYKLCLCVLVLTAVQVKTDGESLKVSNTSSTQYANSTAFDERSGCKPPKNVIFFRIAKTGSTTLREIIVNTFAHHTNRKLVTTGTYTIVGFPIQEPFKRCMFTSKPYSVYRNSANMFGDHTMLNMTEVDAVVGPNPVRITSLRDPTTQLAGKIAEPSKYYPHWPLIPTCTLQFYVDHKGEGCTLGISQKLFSFINNQAKALHIDVSIESHESKRITEAIQELDRYFDLVVIYELYEESLILLKELLCLTWGEIVQAGVHRNIRSKEQKKYFQLSESQKNELRRMSYLDTAVHNYFTKRLRERISHYGVERMAKDVQMFRQKVEEWTVYCASRDVTKADLQDLCKSWKNGSFHAAQPEWFDEYLRDREDLSRQRLDTTPPDVLTLLFICFSSVFLVFVRSETGKQLWSLSKSAKHSWFDEICCCCVCQGLQNCLGKCTLLNLRGFNKMDFSVRLISEVPCSQEAIHYCASYFSKAKSSHTCVFDVNLEKTI